MTSDKMTGFKTNEAGLRILLATTTWLAPMAAIAQTGDGGAGIGSAPGTISPLTPQTVGVINLELGRVLSSPAAELWPTEVLGAGGLQYAGFDPRTIERITATIESPAGGQLHYAIAVRFTEPFRIEQLAPDVLSKLTPVDGPTGMQAHAVEPDDSRAPVLLMADEKTLLAAPRATLDKLLRANRPPAEGPFIDWIESRSATNELHIGVHFDPLRPLARMAIAGAMQQARAETPEELLPLLEELSKAPDEVRYIEVWANVSSHAQVGAAVEASDAESADRLAKVLEAWRDFNLGQIEEVAAQLDRSDPTQSAVADYLNRVGPRYIDATQPRRDGVRFYRAVPDGEPGDAPMELLLTQTAVIGILVALLLPAVQAAREAARRNQSLNNTKQMMLALHNYHDVNNAFPTQAIVSEAGEPLLSWRVALLPYLGEEALYERFALDEPWDSPTNFALLGEMPELFSDPSGQLDVESGLTHYLGVAGDGAFFDVERRPRRFAGIRDGLSRTIAVVQVDDEHAVPWTQPADYEVRKHAADPTAGIGVLHPGVFLAGYADGHAGAVSIEIDPTVLRAMFTVDGGERVELP